MQQWTMEATGHRTGRVSSLQGPQARPRRLPTKQAEGITGACSHLGLSLQEQRPVGRGTTSTRIYTRVCVCLHIYMNRYTHTHRFMGVCIHTGTHICECVHTCLLSLHKRRDGASFAVLRQEFLKVILLQETHKTILLKY